MADKEIIFTIPLRKEGFKVPRYKRASKAVKTVRKFLKRHMKSENIKIGAELNKKLFSQGRKNVVPRVKVHVIKEKEKIKDKEVEIVKAELIGFEFAKKKEEKKESLTEKLKGKIGLGKGEEKKEAEAEKKEDAIKEEEKILEKGIGKGKRFEETKKGLTKKQDNYLREEKIITRSEKKDRIR